MKILGIFIILNALAFCGVWVTGNNQYKGWVFTLTLAAVFAGIFLVVSNRETEVSIKGVGTIKAAAEAAEADADAVAAIKKRVESQSATIDLIANVKRVKRVSQITFTSAGYRCAL